MLFAIAWENRAGATEESDKRSLKLFKNWQPPAGLDFKGFYDYADANGGIAIAEANSAEVILEATSAPSPQRSKALSSAGIRRCPNLLSR